MLLAMARYWLQAGYGGGFDKPFYPCMGRNLAWERSRVVEGNISVLAACPDNAGFGNAFFCSKENVSLGVGQNIKL